MPRSTLVGTQSAVHFIRGLQMERLAVESLKQWEFGAQIDQVYFNVFNQPTNEILTHAMHKNGKLSTSRYMPIIKSVSACTIL